MYKAGKGSHQGLGTFVTIPFVKWTTAKESFKRHSETEYHKISVALSLAEQFTGIMKHSCLDSKISVRVTFENFELTNFLQ